MRRWWGSLVIVGVLASALAGTANAGTRRNVEPSGPSSPDPWAWSRVRLPTAGPSQAIGRYGAGCLAGGVPLAGEGLGYQAIRLSRQRNYAHPALIRYLEELGAKVAERGLGTMLVGDVAQPRGGPMSFGHASHQIGLDADIWLRLDLPAMPRAEREHLEEVRVVDYRTRKVNAHWTPAQAEMIRTAASDPRVELIFVNPIIKEALCHMEWPERAWLHRVRPWNGHDGHMHIRLQCPADSPSCVVARDLPDGEGCGRDLSAWVRHAVPAMDIPPEKAHPHNPRLPEACWAVLDAPGSSVAAIP